MSCEVLIGIYFNEGGEVSLCAGYLVVINGDAFAIFPVGFIPRRWCGFGSKAKGFTCNVDTISDLYSPAIGGFVAETVNWHEVGTGLFIGLGG